MGIRLELIEQQIKSLGSEVVIGLSVDWEFRAGVRSLELVDTKFRGI